MKVVLNSLILIVALLVSGLARSETISVVVPWQGEGQIFPIGADTLRFLGSVEGVMYAESEDGAMNEAFVRCPISHDIDLNSGRTTVAGNCMIVAGPDDSVYAEIRCEGTQGLCKGVFTITGGTGRFAGITGSGPMTARSPISTLARNVSDGTVLQEAIGILQLQTLKLSLP